MKNIQENQQRQQPQHARLTTNKLTN